MAHVTGYFENDQNEKLVRLEIYTDASTDLEGESFEVSGIPAGYAPMEGTYFWTALGEIGIMDSTHTVHWVGTEDTSTWPPEEETPEEDPEEEAEEEASEEEPIEEIEEVPIEEE